MFKKMRRFMFAISGSTAALLALYLYRQRGTRKFYPTVKETLINVDEVPREDITQIDEIPASPTKSKSTAQAKKKTNKSEPSTQAPVPQKDDLKRIEGIGPKTVAILKEAGITSFQALAALKPEEIKEILRAANGRGVPTTWPQQAKLAAAGNWDALSKLQGELKGGR